MLRLDVIVPTYNRAHLLSRTLQSLTAAEVPPGLEVRLTVVDNNSTDETPRLIADWQRRFEGRLAYVAERKQGRSHALNAGIAATSGELVGMIDDDEEVDGQWYVRAASAFTDEGVDFVGGPYVPRWGAKPPPWLPPRYRGVIGWIDGGDKVTPFDDSYPGILMGGNAVLRRSILLAVGGYLTSVSRQGNRLLAGEDEDMYRRLRQAGARGLYLPDLIIYHYIPPERLTKRYYRRWCFWRGVSCGVLDRQGHGRQPVAYLAGVPRYLYGQAARALLRKARGLVTRDLDPGQDFENELAWWDLAGFLYGKHLYRPAPP